MRKGRCGLYENLSKGFWRSSRWLAVQNRVEGEGRRENWRPWSDPHFVQRETEEESRCWETGAAILENLYTDQVSAIYYYSRSTFSWQLEVVNLEMSLAFEECHRSNILVRKEIHSIIIMQGLRRADFILTFFTFNGKPNNMLQRCRLDTYWS